MLRLSIDKMKPKLIRSFVVFDRLTRFIEGCGACVCEIAYALISAAVFCVCVYRYVA